MTSSNSPNTRTRAILTVCITILLLTCSHIVLVGRSVLQQSILDRYAQLSANMRRQVSLLGRTPTERARQSLQSWLEFLHLESNTLKTKRIGCREHPDGAQTCVFEGLICIDTSPQVPFGRPHVYFVDDTRTNGSEVPSDRWCSFRYRSSDPRYWGGRHWPILPHTVSPRWSCLQAYYRTLRSMHLGRGAEGVKWVPSLWLVDFDFISNPHNNHFLMDLIWILDAALWQASVDLRPRPGGRGWNRARAGAFRDGPGQLFSGGPRWLYLPQGRDDFETQTAEDMNRLIFALVLQLNASRLYDGAPAPGARRETRALLRAFPALRERLLFHRALRADASVRAVCTARLTAGAKLATGGHERVCRAIRQRAWALYGIAPLPVVQVGQAYYARPPRRIVVLQRHVTRKIRNVGKLTAALAEAFPPAHGFAVDVVSTADLTTAEEWVRAYAAAGVMLAPHGSQNMGELFMPRHSALIEIMPVGYVDYSFEILSRNCRVWYYQLQSLRNPDVPETYFTKHCRDKWPHMLSPCSEVKSVDVQVDIRQAVRTVGLALERIGYVTKPWMEFVQFG